MSACICTLAYMRWTRKACCLFTGFSSWFRFCFMGNMELASVCLHCLSVTGTYSHSPQCLKQNQPNNTTDRILVNRLYLNKWTFLPETCFLVFSFFYIVNFLHWQSILELKSWVWSYYLFDSLVFKVHDIIWWHRLSIFTQGLVSFYFLCPIFEQANTVLASDLLFQLWQSNTHF